jgi:hypothetical protein
MAWKCEIRYYWYQTWYREVNEIKSNEFLKKLYTYLDNQQNQSLYIIRFFNAAGSQYFTVPVSYANRTNDSLEGARRYIKDRPLTDKLKESFPDPINMDALTEYIEKNLNREKLRACMENFGIPTEAVIDKKKFAQALAIQFSKFVRSVSDNVDDSVSVLYQGFLRGESVPSESLSGPKYKGDDVLVDIEDRSYKADCYQIIHHVWTIQNRGNKEWHGRRLVLINGDKIRPRPDKISIPVPDTAPGEYIKIATDIDSRGFEGSYECEWQMQDAEGKNCFPNHKWDLNVRIDVSFHWGNGGESRG